MALSPHNLISHNKTTKPFSLPRISTLHNTIKPLSSSLYPLSFSTTTSSSFTSYVAKIIPPVQLEDSTLNPNPVAEGWIEFAGKVSGEWDGHGADFTREGKPVELPESVVPEAYREWEVKVFDWQTQCPTLAQQEDLVLSYRLIRLLPTVGCEADAATVYSSEEKKVGGDGSNALAFAYQSSGCYLALWPGKASGSSRLLEVEHCLIDPRNRESRVRIIQVVLVEETKLSLQNIRVFCEQWYGPFRNGEQLGGCAIRDSGFAATDALKASEVRGVWESHEAVANFEIPETNVLQQLTDGGTREIERGECDVIPLPRQLWCSLKESDDGEARAEVGWLLDGGTAISSRCVFSSDGKLKEMAVGHEVPADQDI